jgi:CheY-like chemotaxis protein
VRSHSVLVVDDEANVRSLYRDALSDAGHEVTVACDGVAALEILRHGRVPCVVLSDVRMPRMDGFELSRALAADPQLATVPIVVMTGDKVLSWTSPARDKYAVDDLEGLVERSCRLHRAGGSASAPG